MQVAQQLYRRLPEAAKTHLVRDATLEQALYLSAWFFPAVLLIPFGLGLIGIPLIIYGLIGALPTRHWGPRYAVRQDNRSDRRIAKRDGQIYDPAAEGKKAQRRNYLVPLRIYEFGMVPGVGQVSTIYNDLKDTDTIIVRVNGRPGLLDDLPDRYANEQRIIDMMKTIISSIVPNIVFSFINGTRPYDPTALDSDLDRNFNNAQVKLRSNKVDEWLSSQIDNMIGQTVTECFKPFYAVALTVPRPVDWRKHDMATKGANPEVIPGSYLDRLIRGIVPGLRSVGYEGVELLDADALHRLIFTTWNVSYVMEMMTDHTKAYDAQQLEWPTTGMWAKDGVLQTGEHSFHAVILKTGYRSPLIEPGGLLPLLSHPLQWMYTAACSSTMSPTLESWLLDRTTRFRDAWSKASHPGGAYTNLRDIERNQAPVEAFNALYLSRSKAIRFSVPIVVSGTSAKMVEQNVSEIMGKLDEYRIRSIRVESATRLTRIFFSATLGLRT